MARPIDPEFAPHLLASFHDPYGKPIHELFNRWWKHAPPELIEAWAGHLRSEPGFDAFAREAWLAEPTDVEALSRCPEGSLGRGYLAFLRDNGLEEKLATNYRVYQDKLKASGFLAGIPEDMEYMVLRVFQLHDIMHVLTGYDSSPLGEIGLQSFYLAQVRFPYFAMWISATTTRATYVDPKGLERLMDAISAGWMHGRQTPQLQFGRWEEHFAEPLEALRERFGIVPMTRERLRAAA